MGRQGTKDRGLFQRTLPSGKTVWCYRFYWQGREVKKKGGRTKEEARRAMYAMQTDLARGTKVLIPQSKDSLAAAIERYRPVAKRLKNYQKSRHFFEWWTLHFGKIAITALTPTHLEQAQHRLMAEKKTAGTINRYTDWLRHVLNREIRDGRLLVNPVTRITRMREPKGRVRFLSQEEEAKLLAALGPVYAPYARFAILTGLRQAEQFRLEWAHVDLEQGLVMLPVTKAGETQYLPLNEEAKAILRGLNSWQRSKWVFPSQRPERPLDACNFMRLYRAAVVRAGIPWVSWHDLRHTFASRLAMQGVPLTTIAALLRHSTTGLVKRYAHLSPTYLQGAIEEVSKFGRLSEHDEPGRMNREG